MVCFSRPAKSRNTLETSMRPAASISTSSAKPTSKRCKELDCLSKLESDIILACIGSHAGSDVDVQSTPNAQRIGPARRHDAWQVLPACLLHQDSEMLHHET